MPKEKYDVAIVGAGGIAAGYDSPGDEKILTHAHAITKSPRLRCLGFFDTDKARAESASSKWGFPFIQSFDGLMKPNPDIVVICTPDLQHFEDLKRLLPHHPSCVLCEKPMTTSLADTRSMVSAFEREGILLMVNYQRRYDPLVISLKKETEERKMGTVIAVNVLYSKGILHNGSHAVNLLLFLFGKPQAALVTRKVHDFYESDPTVDASLFYDSFMVNLISGNESEFSIFEVDLVFQNGRIRFTGSGNEYERYTVSADPLFPGYRELKLGKQGSTGLRFAMETVYKDIVQHLDDGKKSHAYLHDVLYTQEICGILSEAPLFQYQKINLA